MNDELVYRPTVVTAIVPVPETAPPSDKGATVEQVAEALVRDYGWGGDGEAEQTEGPTYDMSELPAADHDMTYYRKPEPEPKLLGTVKVTDPHLFGKLLKVLKTVDDGEIPLAFNPLNQTIGFTFMDPSEVRMIDTAYPASVPINIRSRAIVNPDWLVKLFGKMKKDTESEVFEFDVYGSQLAFRLDGEAMLKMTIPTWRPKEKPRNPPVITFHTTLTLETKTFLDALDPIAKLKLDRVTLSFDGAGNLVIAGSTSDDGRDVTSTTLSKNSQFVPLSGADADSKSTYDVKFLLGFAKALKQLSDTLTLDFGKGIPLRIAANPEGIPYLRFYQAAILES